ncbi:DoxX family protein [Texcoconibacillus texcoconensis]|uniref:Thiosulfate dehydrogenase [quinone] large subunit n=1 Tax=Texcoconibacillus texcoconensis TaxID=1095777 RepID=A0A840QMJ9_9BACI|nr:DoxX family protein [Texcoconibacillus texcoconensis]MBB5172597.1 thiosulfate dehydrogenase [quinone] large subunit [Texcoconibacillus texcoconensis]
MTNVNRGDKGNEIIVEENPVSRFLFSNTRSAWIWLILRLYLGYSWLEAGWGKVGAEGWTGENAGAAIEGYMGGALARAAEGDVATWYAWFLEQVVIPNATPFAYMVAWGEVLVGLGLIVGFLTGIAAFFGALMNMSFLLAGTVSTNPVMLMIAIFLILAWKVAGWYGVDRWALPYLGTPWKRKQKE